MNKDVKDNMCKEYKFFKKINLKENDEIKSPENKEILINKDSKMDENILISTKSLNKNYFPKKNNQENNIETNIENKDILFFEYNNKIFQYYYTTIKYFINYNNDYNNIMPYFSKNYIPKFKNHINNNQNLIFNKEKYNFFTYNYEINNKINNCINNYYNKFQFNQIKNNIQKINISDEEEGKITIKNNLSDSKNEEKNSDLNVNLNNNENENIVNEINNPPFVPSNFSRKNTISDFSLKEKESQKDKESASTSEKTSPSISEKDGKKKINYFNVDEKYNINNVNNALNKEEYLVEMFGRKGWICIFCNNFNYETRSKCNRCGIMKRPKKIIENKIKIEKEKPIEKKCEKSKEKEKVKEIKDLKDNNNKKGDWICSNCKNLNYSFRTVCNRCKIPKIYYFINKPTSYQNKNIINNNFYYPYYISPAFIVFNNMPNIIINNFENNKGNDK